MPGYHNNPRANFENFPGDGWFDSGDLGFLHRGRLYLTGRAKEMIIIRGANYYCYEIEEVVMQEAGTVPARVAATSVYDEAIATERLLIFFVPEASAVPPADVALLHTVGEVSTALYSLVTRVRACVVAKLGLAPGLVMPVLEASFHRTTSGKIQRGAFQKEFKMGMHSNAAVALDTPATSLPAVYEITWTPPTTQKDEDKAVIAAHATHVLTHDMSINSL